MFAAAMAEAAGETLKFQVQRSWVDDEKALGDAERNAMAAAFGRAVRNTWTGPLAGTRTTAGPEHHAAESELMPVSLIVAFGSWKPEGTAGDSWPLGWPCCRCGLQRKRQVRN